MVGTSCVGKSSLLEDLTAHLGSECEPVREAARIFFMHHYQPEMGGRFSAPVQGMVQRVAQRNEKWADHYAALKYAKLGRVAIVCDRTVFDAPVYVAADGDEQGALDLLDQAYDWTKESPYDRIYLLDPADVPYSTDPIRTELPETRQRFHDTYLEFFALHGIAYELLRGSREQRLAGVAGSIAEAYTL